VDAGVNHIDTAQTYGAGEVNELIREALFPYPDELALVSKVAARRDEGGALLPIDDSDQLRADIEENLTTLGVAQLTAVNLRVMDNDVPDARFVDQLGALVRARDEGLIGGIGISNVTRGHLLRALEVTEIVCVQNFFNLADRNSLPIVNECTVRNIALVPFCPLGYPRAQREAILTNPAVDASAHLPGFAMPAGRLSVRASRTRVACFSTGRISARGRVITARTAARQVCHASQRALERRSPRSVLMVFIVMRESTRAIAGSPISWVVTQRS
jgi:aryl-alcohol dehydrogenase-like predicted oxidoreductase